MLLEVIQVFYRSSKPRNHVRIEQLNEVSGVNVFFQSTISQMEREAIQAFICTKHIGCSFKSLLPVIVVVDKTLFFFT